MIWTKFTEFYLCEKVNYFHICIIYYYAFFIQ